MNATDSASATIEPASPTVAGGDDQARRVEVLVIGGGFGGIASAVHLKRAGIDNFVILEKASELGGTWRENTYPGCGCDIPSSVYSFSFAPKPDWDFVFARQPQIKQYIIDTADRFEVTKHVEFGVEALEGAWDDDAQHWVVDTTAGRLLARTIITATGPLHEPEIPSIPGLDGFTGKIFHSSHWDHDHDLTGKRVAVIGTGASAIQFVPQIQKRVGKLVLFQRTPPWVLPKPDHKIPKIEKALFKYFPPAQRALRETLYHGQELIQLAQRRPRVMRVLQLYGRLHLRLAVKDRKLRKQLTPRFTLGCKRILIANDYYPALQRENVEVVASGVSEVRGNRVVDDNGAEHEVDTIILATGFKATDPPIADRVRLDANRTLAGLWNGTPQAYKGTVVAGAPNAFILVGPNTANGHQSIISVIEYQLEYAVRALKAMRAHGLASFEVRPEVQRAYNEQVQRALQGTVWNAGGCQSYYLDRNGVNSTIYPWTTLRMRREMQDFRLEDFRIRSLAEVAVRA